VIIRRTAAAAFAAALTSTSVLAASTVAAEAAAPSASTSAAPSVHAKGCVTKAEYRKVKKGMAQSKVHKIFGTKGKVGSRSNLPDGVKLEARSYKVCGSKPGGVGVSYTKKPGKSYKLAAKAAEF